MKSVVEEVKLNDEFSIDWEFIRTLEGFSATGYIPSEKNERNNRIASGVTIGSGFDLGQHGMGYLQKLQLPLTTEKKLAPYIGLVADEARVALMNRPLILTKEEANIVDQKVKRDKAVETAERYNRDSTLNFYDLTKAEQTVIMSVAFQYGDPSRRTPNYWKVVTDGNWAQAVWHLNNFGDSYKTRRRKEAKYLEESLNLTVKKV